MKYRPHRNKLMSVKIFSVVAAYWIISISLVFINKWLLSGNNSTVLEAPLFITWFQCLMTAVLCYATSLISAVLPNHVQFPRIGLSLKIAADIMPLSIAFVLMVSLNNLCLKYLSVSFYFLARSLTTIFNVIFTYILLHTKTSFKALLCCVAIIIGYSSGVIVEGNLGSLSWLGLIYGLGSSITCALNSIYTSKSLPKVDGSVWRLTFYNNVNAAVLLIPIVFLTESTVLYDQLLNSGFLFWIIMFVSGIFGFAIGYVSALQIQVTSPLTHNVSGTAKAATQTVLAVLIYHEIKSFHWWLSNLIVLLGSAVYTLVRHNEASLKNHMPETVKHSSDVESEPSYSTTSQLKT